jgi:hypothetical protein
MAVIAIAGAAASMAQQNKNAEQAAEDAQKNALLQQQTNTIAAEQMKDQYALKEFERRRQSIREEAKLRVASGESGLAGGNTPARQVMNVYAQEGFDLGIMAQNRENDVMQANLNGQSIASQGESAVNAALSNTTTGATAGLQIIGAGAQGYQAGSSMRKSYDNYKADV